MSKNILLIEDDFALRSLFQQVVNATGNTVTDVGTRTQALDLLEANTYDLLICDIMLENGNTLDIIKVCAGHGMDVVVITSDESRLAQCRDLGVLAFVRKPVSARDLMTIVTDIRALDLPNSWVSPRVRD